MSRTSELNDSIKDFIYAKNTKDRLELFWMTAISNSDKSLLSLCRVISVLTT